MTAIIHPHAQALALIRDEALTVADLARHFTDSEAFVAGLLDLVTGNQDWRLMFHADDALPTPAEREDYSRGAMTAELLLAAEADADGWADCYAVADAEALRAAELLPAGDDDCPF